ncbi:hypothetical protein [Caulobacter sp.]|uniref:hypothetical protein n=1 Tax=Caulobacter sp. TaxID=78 RepID=UPI001B100743|nr:hypothetical protein [Caulobacter sp.]MBO9545430.1 hypothetical protein [Caulobacter sp.]
MALPYFTPDAATRGAPTRRERIIIDYPQSDSALKQIENSSADVPFGASISTVLNNYHFPSVEDVRNYFEVYVGEREGGGVCVDQGLIQNYIVNTINYLPEDAIQDEFKNDRQFERIFNEFNRQIEQNSRENVATVNLMIGPTGAGKTAFSKSLFTICMRRFWSNGIVPCRVEFSKYDIPKDMADTSHQAEKAFLDFVRQCQLRDLLIYFFVSGTLSYEQKRAKLAELNVSAADRPLHELLEETRNTVVNGETVTLDRVLRGKFLRTIQKLPSEDRNRVLYELSSHLKIKFLVSFDGFDSTKIEHFLFEHGVNLPIHFLVRLLKGIHEKVMNPQMSGYHVESHYLAYLRDTTFNQLQTVLFRGVGDRVDYPCYWIVPPRYAQLVGNTARFLTGISETPDNLGDKFSADITAKFDRDVFGTTGLSAEKHMSFVFGSSGRRMKSHIRQTLMSVLHRLSQTRSYDFGRASSGTGARVIWQDLVGSDALQKLPRYIVLEDLFLNDSRQLMPKLELDSSRITTLLDQGRFEEIARHVTDADELGGIFGCLFNYFYRMRIGEGADAQPALLLLVRIVQFVAKNPRCNADEIAAFLEKIGYDLPQDALHFCVFVILRSELVKWDGTTGVKTIREVPLYLTTTGAVALDRLLFSITYLSEAFLSSIQIDRELTNALQRRNSDLALWIADCVSNASIALYQIGKIEEIEQAAAKRQGVNLEPYLLGRRLRKHMAREAILIIGSFKPASRTRYSENLERLRRLGAIYPGLVILGDRR